MFNIGDTVITKTINNEEFTAKIVELDRFGFAVVSFNNISEGRVHTSQLTKEGN